MHVKKNTIIRLNYHPAQPHPPLSLPPFPHPPSPATLARMTHDTPESVTIVLPLPSPYLHPNKQPRTRKGHIIKAKLTRERRALCKALASAQSLDSIPWEEATLQAHFFFETNRRRDADNLLAWCKSTVDGIADAGIIINDSGFTYPPVQSSIDKDCPRLELTITRTK